MTVGIRGEVRNKVSYVSEYVNNAYSSLTEQSHGRYVIITYIFVFFVYKGQLEENYEILWKSKT